MKRVFLLLLTIFIMGESFSQMNTEQKLIKQIFFDFLKLYQKNEAKFNSFRLYKGTGKENNPPYKIQWKEVDRYFAYLKASVPYVGQQYILSEKNHFKYADSSFKADPEEEIAAGFDYDRWAGGQDDVKYLVKWHTSPQNKFEVKITGNTAILRIGAELYEGASENERSWSFVPFKKENGKWKMADNILPESDDEE